MSCSSSCSSCSTVDDDALHRSLPPSPLSSDDSSACHLLSPSILQQLEQRLLKALRSYSVPISFDSPASSTSSAPPPPSLPLPSFEEDFHFICHHLCNDSASSFNVFIELFDSLGIKEFFRVVHRLIQLNIYSHLIAWSYQFANDDPQRFYSIVIGQQSQSKGKIIKKNNDSNNANTTTSNNNNNNNNNNEGMGDDDLQLIRTKLIAYINKEAAIYECFPSHGKLPRAKSFSSLETNNDTKNTTTTTNNNNNNNGNNNNNTDTKNHEENHSSSSECTNGGLSIDDDSSKDWEHIELDENKNVIFSDEIKEKEKEKLINAPPSASHCSNHLESISLTEQEVEALSTDIANAVQIPMSVLADRVMMYRAIFVLLIAIFIAYFFMAK